MGEILIFSSLFQKNQKFAGEWRKAVDVLRRICYNEENSGKRSLRHRQTAKFSCNSHPSVL